MKKRRLPAIILLSLFILGCHTSSNPPMQNLFRFNLEEGKEYEYEMSWDFDQNIMGQVSKFKVTSLYSLSVTEAVGRDIILTGVYRNFKMSMKMRGIEFNIDTEEPLPPADSIEQMGFMKRAFHGVIGKPFTMRVSEQGELLSVKGFDEMMESIVDSIGLDKETKKLAMESIKDQFNDEAIREQFLQIFAIFPNKVVNVGDTWEKSYALRGKVPAKFTNTYVVKKIDGDLVTLDMKSRIESDTTIGIKGEQAGTIVADSRWGLVIDADFQQDMEIKNEEVTIQMKGNGKIRGKAN